MDNTCYFPVRNYDLGATLDSGQAFRWQYDTGHWIGIIGAHWVRLHSDGFGIRAEAAEPTRDWQWLTSYLQLDIDLTQILVTFPDDPPMKAAIDACQGLRLLRQDPWECLASFILSSTKQIVQIRQIVSLVCQSFGAPIPAGAGAERAYAFPTAARLARATEPEMRACKMGFRAPYLLDTARLIAASQFDLDRIGKLEVEQARAELMDLPGVGRKIADCVLLFAYGFQSSFPVDVWVLKALRRLYFGRRRVTTKRIHEFTQKHFGPNGGYAQQYLFHYMRTRSNRNK
jgi:N-glycosylase/DNA lyase